MDNLHEMVLLLEEGDKKEFQDLLNKPNGSKKRKDLQLFKLLTQDKKYKKGQLQEQIYGTANAAAYYALRKRLEEQLCSFIARKRQEDETIISDIMRLAFVSRYMFEKNAHKLAWKYLRKAEKMAKEGGRLLLLNFIYLMQIEHATSQYADPFDEIIAKWGANQKAFQEEQRAVIAMNVIKLKLKNQKIDGKAGLLELETVKLIKEYGLDVILGKNPRVLCVILNMIRSPYLARQVLPQFSNFAISKYNAVEGKNLFTQHNHWYKLEILYIITHALYRELRFEECLEYLSIFKEAIYCYNRNHHNEFYPRYVLLQAHAEYNTGDAPKAIKRLEDTLQEKNLKMSLKNEANMRLNLAGHYIFHNRASEVHPILNCRKCTDKYLEKNLGKEWLLKKKMIELAALYEEGKIDQAFNLLRAIERNFKTLFEASYTYQRAKIFLGFGRKMLQDPKWLTKEVFLSAIRSKLDVVVNQKEEPQTIAFFSWLKAKALQQKPYETMLDIIANATIEKEQAGLEELLAQLKK